jgi:hypothetical protein
MPSPGAVCPATVTYPLAELIVQGDNSRIKPDTRNTIVLGPDASIAAR